MKKKLLITILISILSISIFASPFELAMGMTLQEITEACNGNEPHKVEEEVYLIQPAKAHPLFDYYAVYVNEKVGLYQIRALSSPINSNKYGEEIQNAFLELKDRISKTYGKPEIIDTVDKNISSTYKKNDYWFYALREGSRKLYALWGKNKTLDDNIDTIVLDCSVTNGFYEGEGQLILYYYFKNYSSVEDEQDSVF